MGNPEENRMRVKLPPETRIGTLHDQLYAITPLDALAQEQGELYMYADVPAAKKRLPVVTGLFFVAGIVIGVGASVGAMLQINNMNNDLQAAHNAAAPKTSGLLPSTTAFPSSTPSLEQTPVATPPASATQTPSAAAKKQTIFLDPGHSGKNVDSTDPDTLLIDKSTHNEPETKENYTVALMVKQALEAQGYTVVMSKDAADDVKSSRDRSNEAIAAKADIAVSIHDDHTQTASFQAVYPQKVGLYRQAKADAGEDMPPLKFTNAQTACVSQQYATILQGARATTQGRNVRIAQLNFDDRPGYSKGNISLVQLFTQGTPWVYNEMGAKTGKKETTAISEVDLQKYATGITNGIKAAMEQQTAINAKCGK